MADSPELLLEVKLPDGESRSYTLEYGRLTIGSGKDCEIRVEEPGVEEAHALLLVELDGITLVNLREPASVRVGGAPLSGNRKIGPHDPVSVAGIRLKLVPYGYTGEFIMPADRDIPADLEARAYEDLQKGMPGYRLLRDRLYTHLDPDEAAAGERQFRRMRRGLFTVVGVLAFWRLTTFYVPSDAIAAQLGAIYPGLRLLGLLVLGGVLGLSVAGRVVLPLLALWLLVNEVGQSARNVTAENPSLYDVTVAFYLVAGLAIGYGAGVLFDYGISMRPAPSDRQWRRYALMGFAGLALAFAIFVEEPPWYGVAVIGLCAAWGWWPGPQIADRRRRSLRRDTRVLASAAELRWLRSFGGVALAAILGFFPVFLFFNTFELRDGMHVDLDTWPSEQALVGTGHAAAKPDVPFEVVWVWSTRGRLLRGSDFAQPGFTMYSDWRPATEALMNRLANAAAGATGSRDADDLLDNAAALDRLLRAPAGTPSGVTWLIPRAHDELTDALLDRGQRGVPSRIVSYDEFVDRTNANGPLLVMQVPTPEERRDPRRWYWLETLDARAIPRSEAEWVRVQVLVLPPVLVLFGLMSFLFLVRRGGDSPAARWIGIWLAGEAAAYFLFAVGEYVDPARWRMMTVSATESPVWESLADALDLLEWIAGWNSSGLWAVSIPFCFLWVHLCWPTSPWRYPTAWRRSAEIVGKAALVGLGLFATGWVFNALLSADVESFDILTASPSARVRELVLWLKPAILLSLVVGAFVRRGGGAAASEVPRLGMAPVLAFLGVTTGPVFLYHGLKGWNGELFVDRFFYSVTMIGALLVGMAIVAFLVLLRRDFLHVANASTLVWVALAIFVPAAVGVIEAILVSMFEGAPVVSAGAARGFGIFVVAVLLPKIHGGLHKGVERLLVPQLPKIRHAVDQTLETVADAGDKIDRRGEVAAALERLGIERYAVYKRGRHDELEGMVTFDRYLHRSGAPEPPEAVPLSDYLREFLGKRRNFVDFEAAPLEWRLFFQQFELHRLERVLGFRYLLPICLGSSVRGLLLLGDGEAERQISQDPAAGRLGTLGLGGLE